MSITSNWDLPVVCETGLGASNRAFRGAVVSAGLPAVVSRRRIVSCAIPFRVKNEISRKRSARLRSRRIMLVLPKNRLLAHSPSEIPTH